MTDEIVVEQFQDDRHFRYAWIVGDALTGEILTRETQARCEQYRRLLMGVPGMLDEVRSEIRISRGERADYNPDEEHDLDRAIEQARDQHMDLRVGPRF